MGFLNTDCQNPDCDGESAFHNGQCYECPDCGYEWGCIEEEEEENEESNDE